MNSLIASPKRWCSRPRHISLSHRWAVRSAVYREEMRRRGAEQSALRR
ncbi:hypothetical protein chiPu_0027150, partial [Chiloscyllium punctatum]|nr:hypothetical protein [Chiloscyllium punctatum]